MVLWLIHDDRFIDIPAKTATDKNLQLTQTAVAVIGFGFLFGRSAGLLLNKVSFYTYVRARRFRGNIPPPETKFDCLLANPPTGPLAI